MSRKQLVLILVLSAVCAWVNRGLFLDTEQTESVTIPTQAIMDSEPAPGDLDHLSPGRATSPQPGPTTVSLAAPSREQVLLSQLAKRLMDRAEQKAADGSIPNPFGHENSRSRSREASKREKQRLKAEEEARRKAALLAAQAEKERKDRITSLESIPIHAIIVSKTAALARIKGQNLGVGDVIPGTEARITAIRRRYVEVTLGKDRVIIPLTAGKKVRRQVPTTPNETERSAQVTPPPALLPSFGGGKSTTPAPPAGGNS